MARRVFFSFEYSDIWRVNQVRNSWVTQGNEAAGFWDAADREQIQRQGDAAIRAWIDSQLTGTSVTAVLVGAHTCSSVWVSYEIEASKRKGNGLLGIDISSLQDQNGHITSCCGVMPAGYDFYNWVYQDGYNNLGYWIEAAYQSINSLRQHYPSLHWPQ